MFKGKNLIESQAKEPLLNVKERNYAGQKGTYILLYCQWIFSNCSHHTHVLFSPNVPYWIRLNTMFAVTLERRRVHHAKLDMPTIVDGICVINMYVVLCHLLLSFLSFFLFQFCHCVVVCFSIYVFVDKIENENEKWECLFQTFCFSLEVDASCKKSTRLSVC